MTLLPPNESNKERKSGRSFSSFDRFCSKMISSFSGLSASYFVLKPTIDSFMRPFSLRESIKGYTVVLRIPDARESFKTVVVPRERDAIYSLDSFSLNPISTRVFSNCLIFFIYVFLF